MSRRLTLDEHLRRLEHGATTRDERERSVAAVRAVIAELQRCANRVAETAGRAHAAEVENEILCARIDEATRAVASAAAALAQTKRDRAFLAGAGAERAA